MTIVDRVAWVVIDGQRYVDWDDVMEYRWWRSLTAEEQAAVSQESEEAHELGMAMRDQWARSRYEHLLAAPAAAGQAKGEDIQAVAA